MKGPSRKFLLCAAMAALSLLLVSCGGGGGGGGVSGGAVQESATRAYVGTQTAGDFWTWSVTTSDGTETFIAANQYTGYSYSGTATPLTGNATGFTKLTYTASTDPDVTAGDTAYMIEIPDTVVIAVPGPFTQLNNGDGILYTGSNNPPVMAVEQGTCPTLGGSFNWVMVPPMTWCSGDDPNPQAACPQGNSVGPAYGTTQITVLDGSYGMTVQPFLLSGTAQAPFTMTGAVCSDGVIRGTDSLGRALNVAFTPSGLFFIDLPRGQGSMVGADAGTTLNFTDFLENGRAFAGFSFMSIRDFGNQNPSYTAPDTAPVQATANGTTINGTSFSDLDSGTLVQSGSGAGAALNLVSQPSPGLITYTVQESDGTHNGVFVVTQIGGKYYFFSISDHWEGSGSGADEMAGQNIFGIETQ